MTEKHLENIHEKNIGQIPEAIEGAFIVVLAQNALLLSKPLVEIGTGNGVQTFHVIIVAISLLNFFNIAANWLSVRKVTYTHGHLFWDIITLAVFFVLAQVLIDTYSSNLHSNLFFVLMITSIFYLLLNMVYIVWNNIEIANSRKPQSEGDPRFARLLQKANKRNYVSMFFALVMGIASFFPSYEWILVLSFTLWLINWTFVIAYYIGEQGFWN